MHGMWGWLLIVGCSGSAGPATDDSGEPPETDSAETTSEGPCDRRTPTDNPAPPVLADSDFQPYDTDPGTAIADACAAHTTFADCEAGESCVSIVMAPVDLDAGTCGNPEFLACRSIWIDSEGRQASCPDAADQARIPGRGCYATTNTGTWCTSNEWARCADLSPLFSCDRSSFCEP